MRLYLSKFQLFKTRPDAKYAAADSIPGDSTLLKIQTFAFDIRPHLYPVLEGFNFKLEARLKEHCYFNGEYIDVLIHAKINKNE